MNTQRLASSLWWEEVFSSDDKEVGGQQVQGEEVGFGLRVRVPALLVTVN